MLKFMLLDLFSFRSVGSKLKFMQIITILNILKILKIMEIVIVHLYYWRSHFLLTFSIGAPYFFAPFYYF